MTASSSASTASCHRIDFRTLTGKGVTIYGQHEVVKDLIARGSPTAGRSCFEVDRRQRRTISTAARRKSASATTARRRRSTATSSPAATASTASAGRAFRDGVAHGLRARLSVRLARHPGRGRRRPSDELIYAHHERGFALLTMRSPTLARLYLQCAPDDDIDALARRAHLGGAAARLGRRDGGLRCRRGRSCRRASPPMRSFVAEPMQYGRLFLAGDAAHIVPPTGAKGMNLAHRRRAGAVARRSAAYYRSGRERPARGLFGDAACGGSGRRSASPGG